MTASSARPSRSCAASRRKNLERRHQAREHAHRRAEDQAVDEERRRHLQRQGEGVGDDPGNRSWRYRPRAAAGPAASRHRYRPGPGASCGRGRWRRSAPASTAIRKLPLTAACCAVEGSTESALAMPVCSAMMLPAASTVIRMTRQIVPKNRPIPISPTRSMTKRSRADGSTGTRRPASASAPARTARRRRGGRAPGT